MRKVTLKRIGIGLLQHILAAVIFIAVAGLLLNSYVEVESIDGTQVYQVFPFESDQEFEESEVFHNLFRNAVSDITQLVMIKGQLETAGVFDPAKKVDVTAYAAKMGEDNECPVTAVYELDDMIKWGKYGVEKSNRILSMSEFVNYFGDVIFIENFKLDEFGQLRFAGFNKVGDEEKKQEEDIAAANEVKEDNMVGSSENAEQQKLLQQAFDKYSNDELEDMVFSYIMTRGLDNITMSREDDGSYSIYLQLLNCRYETVGGEKQLLALADNWIDYMKLQNNVEMSIEQLTLNYQRYQVCNEAYMEGKSNIKYMIRMMTDDGICTYTNVSELAEMEDNDVTEFFSEYRRYLIYYPDDLEFMGNTVLSEEEIDEYISVYDYAYPDTTHIWLGIDTGYGVHEDVFYNASAVYNRIVPNVGRIIAGMIGLAVIWLGIGIYLTVTAGVWSTKREKGWNL